MEFKPTHKIIAANDTDQFFVDGEEVMMVDPSYYEELRGISWGGLQPGYALFIGACGMFQEVKYVAVEAI